MSSEINELKKNSAYKIEIYSFSNPKLSENGSTITFPAFVTDFSDNYKSDWNQQRVLGKMDPISTFKNTSRTISLAFDVPSEDADEAEQNLRNIDYIIRGMYPVYDDDSYGRAVLASPPLFRVRFSNFIRSAASDMQIGETLRSGLLCYFNDFSFKPNNTSGYFIKFGDLFPRLINVSLNLSVIHEHPLGKTTKTDSATEDGKDGKKITKYTTTVIYRNGFDQFPRLSNNPLKDPDIEQPKGVPQGTSPAGDSQVEAATQAAARGCNMQG